MSVESERRIYPPREYESTLNALVDEHRVFETKQKALMFAAALGRYRDQRQELSSRGVGIREDVFSRSLDDSYVDALAIEVTGQLEILEPVRKDELVTVFEECAKGGLAEIKACLEKPVAPLDELLRLIHEARQESARALPGIAPSVISMLEDV